MVYDKRKKGSAFGYIFVAFLIVLLLFLAYQAYYRYTHITFLFFIADTEERLRGDIFLNNKFIGDAKDGRADFLKKNLESGEILFKAKIENLTIDFEYDLPKDFASYIEIPFTVSENILNEQIGIARLKSADMFSNSSEKHWGHMPLTYFIDISYGAGIYKSKRVIDAFSRVENETFGVVRFKEVYKEEDADIYIRGIYLKREGEDVNIDDAEDNLFTEGLAEHVFLDSLILNASIKFYTAIDPDEGQKAWGLGSCAMYPTTEVHEILHVLGFEHTTDRRSILFPKKELSETCTITSIDGDIVAKLSWIYEG